MGLTESDFHAIIIIGGRFFLAKKPGFPAEFIDCFSPGAAPGAGSGVNAVESQAWHDAPGEPAPCTKSNSGSGRRRKSVAQC